jgi:hypothetical protein
MKKGIDWDAIEQARKSLVVKPEVPPGWITAGMYAKEHSITRNAASGILKRMSDAGAMERLRVGIQWAYRLS